MNQIRLCGALGVLLVLLSGCDPQTQNPINGGKAPATAGSSAKAPMPSGITQKELDDVADIVATADAPEYVLVEIGKESRPKSDPEVLAGLALVARSSAFLSGLENEPAESRYAFIRAWKFDAADLKSMIISHFPQGHSAITFELDGDGIVDLAEWIDPAGRQWLLFNKNAKGLEESCIKRTVAGVGSAIESCLGGKGSRGKIGSAGRTLMGSELAPNCDHSQSPSPMLYDSSDIARQTADQYAEDAREQAQEGDKEGAKLSTEASDAYNQLAHAYEKLETSVASNRAAAEQRVQAALQTAREAGARAFDHVSRNWSPSEIEGMSIPAEDPRCAAIEVDAIRGTLFMNKEFCKGEDPLTCLTRQEDSVIDATGGLCRTEPGPDGGPAIVCDRDKSPLDPSLPKPDYSPVDVPIPRPVRDDQRIFKGYVDVTPLAGVIALRCRAAQGGICGGNP